MASDNLPKVSLCICASCQAQLSISWYNGIVLSVLRPSDLKDSKHVKYWVSCAGIAAF